MLPGLRSRCTIPCRCAAPKASAISLPIRRTWLRGTDAARETCGQRLALQQLEDEKVDPVGPTEIVERADVWMVQGGDGLRLALEPRARRLIRRQRAGQDLQGHGAIEPRVTGPIHFAHPARAEQVEYLVWAETAPREQWHPERGIITLAAAPRAFTLRDPT